MERLSGTRELIFDAALNEFSSVGFEKSNMREIAKKIGIQAASIYNHYGGKEEILSSIYAYYREHFFDNLPSDEQLNQILESGSKQNIVDALFFTFTSTDKNHFRRMLKITKMVYMRLFCDPEAAEIFRNVMTQQCKEKISKLLDRGVKMGRVEHMDTETYALIMMSARHLISVMSFFETENIYNLELEEQKLKHMLQISLNIV